MFFLCLVLAFKISEVVNLALNCRWPRGKTESFQEAGLSNSVARFHSHKCQPSSLCENKSSRLGISTAVES